MEALSITELKRMNLKDATVIDGFPSVGLVSSIVANYIVNSLELEQIGILLAQNRFISVLKQMA